MADTNATKQRAERGALLRRLHFKRQLERQHEDDADADSLPDNECLKWEDECIVSRQDE
jgi:hypothetical protein